MKIGSLFSGYGGLDLAVEAVTGAQPAWFVEYDEAPSKILAHHWPDVPNYGDVTQINWAEVEPVDILTGGSPCQDLSAAGKRAGMAEGTRSNLWVNMREAITQLRPQLVVWENVLGALSAPAESESDALTSDMEQGGGLLAAPPGGHLRALGRVLGDLTEIGYDTEWLTLRASDIGAPHHRARIFLISWPRTTDPESRGRNHGQTTHQRTPHREVHTPHHHRDATTDPESERHFCGGLAVGKEPALTETDSCVSSLSDTEREGWQRWGSAAPQDSESRGAPSVPDGRSSRTEWGRYAPAVRRWERTLGTPAPNPTEPNTKGNPRLAAPFAEWLMGLPPGWVTDPEIGLTRAQQLKAIGNGVCPQQAQTALTQLLERSERADHHVHTDPQIKPHCARLASNAPHAKT